jgi:arsenate reductase-like glutaredoxin family protein
MIKRPIISHGQDSYIGFKAEDYAEVFGVWARSMT